ncbi:MAG: di-trans,poly-cis-decaprenylcistransferase [Clostridia bacterium]|nr:di-trans,poly-cis-decaprenylcistransferase [Clostridia bacterium]
MTDCPLKHVAFIMDGNGRWAKKRRLPRELGHKAGADAFERIVNYCYDIGVGAVTVYAFSTENWKRPKREVDALFMLFTEFIDHYVEKLKHRSVRLIFIGDREPFSESFRKRIENVEKKTENNDKMILYLGVNYGGRDDICHAVNSLIAEGKTNITEEDISNRIYTSLSPDPDLIIRTGGEYRISNFLIWQSAYSELYITDTLWPDMKESDVDLAIQEFMKRERRFGGL